VTFSATQSRVSPPTLKAEDDLITVASEFGLTQGNAGETEAKSLLARERLEADEQSARASGVMVTSTFFINGRCYDGPSARASCILYEFLNVKTWLTQM